MLVRDRNQSLVNQCCDLRGQPHNKLPKPVVCCCCGCCVDVVGACTSMGAELGRTCGGCLGEDDGGDDDVETLLSDSIRGGVGGRVLGCGRSSGIGILLKCTVRLGGGVYAFAEGPSSLMRCSPTEGLVSYITYWCSSSDSFSPLTSAEIIQMRGITGREVGTERGRDR